MKKVISYINNNDLIKCAVAALIGIISFFIVYGKGYLNPTHDGWIMSGYDEGDIIEHYSGWIAYRNSDWGFPIGIAGDMAVPEGTYVSFMDSIPGILSMNDT